LEAANVGAITSLETFAIPRTMQFSPGIHSEMKLLTRDLNPRIKFEGYLQMYVRGNGVVIPIYEGYVEISVTIAIGGNHRARPIASWNGQSLERNIGRKGCASRRKQQHHPGDGFNRSDHRTLLDFDSLPFVELLRRVRSKPVLFGASAENRRLYLGNRNSEWKHALGRYFRYSDTWQLVINTATTIITFLMVFLIQNTQNRDARTIHLKLDELIRCIDLAHDDMINIEKLSDEELAALSKKFDKVRNEFEDRKQRKGGAPQNGRSSMKKMRRSH